MKMQAYQFINQKPFLALGIIEPAVKISIILIDDVKRLSTDNLIHATAVRGVAFN